MAQLTVKDYVEIASWVFAIVVAILAVVQFRQSVSQRKDEHRWKKTQAAVNLVDEMVADPEYSVAATILDDAPCQVRLKRTGLTTVSTAEFEAALSAQEPDERQSDICSAFDAMFYHMAKFNHYIGQGLVGLADVSFPIRYYVARLAPHYEVVLGYLTRHELHEAMTFLSHFPIWRPTLGDLPSNLDLPPTVAVEKESSQWERT